MIRFIYQFPNHGLMNYLNLVNNICYMIQIIEDLTNKLINNLKLKILSIYNNDCHLIILIDDKKSLSKFWSSRNRVILEYKLKQMTGFKVSLINNKNKFISVIANLNFVKCTEIINQISVKNKRRKF